MKGHALPASILAIALVSVAGCSFLGSASESPFPSRPVEIDPGRTPPCDMLSAPQRSSLRLNDGSPGEVTVNGTRSVECTWLGEGAVDYNGQYIPVDAALAITEPGSKVISVNGFGAVQTFSSNTLSGAPRCQVTVDAADGQSIRLQALTRPGESQISLDEQCRGAVDVASMVMTTVVANASG